MREQFLGPRIRSSTGPNKEGLVGAPTRGVEKVRPVRILGPVVITLKIQVANVFHVCRGSMYTWVSNGLPTYIYLKHSMYAIYAYIGMVSGVNVVIYGIHGVSGYI